MDNLVAIFEVLEEQNHGALNEEGQDFIKITKGSFFVELSLLNPVDINPIYSLEVFCIFFLQTNGINPIARTYKYFSIAPNPIIRFVKNVSD